MLPKNIVFSDMLEDMFGSDNTKMCSDVYEDDGKYTVEIDMPGFSKDEITIECNKGNLIVKAVKDSKENNDKHYIKRERIYSSMSRSFYLGEIDEENIKAEFKNGTLKIEVPKIDENVHKKIISID